MWLGRKAVLGQNTGLFNGVHGYKHKGEAALRHYTVLLTQDPEDGGYVVRVPALQGLNTQGDTIAEALATAQEAIELYIEDAMTSGEVIPGEKGTTQAIVLSVAA
jgi:predicted RNase H-like HicB family nuclease